MLQILLFIRQRGARSGLGLWLGHFLPWCWSRSRYDRVLAHGFIMIMKVLIMFKIQIVSSVDCLLASVYLGSSRQVVKVVHFCILQEKSCTASLENKTEAQTEKPESLSGFLAIKIQTYSPEGLLTSFSLRLQNQVSVCWSTTFLLVLLSILLFVSLWRLTTKWNISFLRENDYKLEEMTGDK